MSHADRFIDLALRHDINARILARLPDLGAPDAWLVAGCLFQTVWNLTHKPGHAIDDYDIFYHDASDLSWDAEDVIIRRAEVLFGDLGVRVQVRNQARVHLWYPARFGPGYPKLQSSRDGIDRFLVDCTRVALRPTGGGKMEIYAPCDLADTFAGILRPNPSNLRGDRFLAKAASYQRRWPWLQILDRPFAPAHHAANAEG